MYNTDIAHEEALLFVSESLVTGLNFNEIYTGLKDAGITRTEKQPFTRNEVKELMSEVREQWRQDTSIEIEEQRINQLREIGYIKKRLHAANDWKNLATYLKLESTISGTNIHKKDTESPEEALLAIAATQRIKSLEAAREREEQIIDMTDYIESVT